MYYPCSENKDTDQLHGYCEADLRFCFHIIMQIVGFLIRRLLSWRYQHSIMLVEHGGIVLEHQTPNTEFLGLIPIDGTKLCT